ncbi:hypothetical protein [Shinella sp.]|uniref:hypothetical protein n=1 Tax=Shinella sp. TaxID=1870904 RepID=UPI0039E3AF3C
MTQTKAPADIDLSKFPGLIIPPRSLDEAARRLEAYDLAAPNNFSISTIGLKSRLD